MIAGALIAGLVGWLASGALNWLARWLPARREAAAPTGENVRSNDLSRSARATATEVATTNPEVAATNPGIFRVGPPSRQRELALQAAAALAAIGLWLRYGLALALLPAGVAGLLLLLIAAIDLDRRLVLNEVLIVGSALALLYAAMGGWTQLLNALLGGALALGLFILVALLPRLIVRSGTLMGVGDVKLAGLIGLLFGYPAGLQALFLGVIAGGLVSAALLLTRRLPRKATIPYAPFLAVGGIAVLLLERA